MTKLLESPPTSRPVPRRRRARDLAEALAAHPWLVVGVIAAAACAWIASHSVAITEWVVMTDELQHIKLAVSVFSEPTLEPAIRGHDYGAYSHLYPLLTSPLWAIFAVPEAWRLTHFANAAFFASAAIPVYLLTRQVVPSRVAGYATALASVAIPWAGMTLMVMTESAAYPAFLWGVLAVQVAVTRGTPRYDLLALGALVLAFLGRTQLIVLAGILPLAILLHEFGYPLVRPGAAGRRHGLRDGVHRLWARHKVLIAVYGLAAVAMLALGPRRLVDEAIGNYGGTTTAGDLLPAGFWDLAPQQLLAVVVGAAALPFLLAVAWAVGSLLRPSDRAGHAYAVIFALTVPLLTWEVTTFGINHVGTALIDRYLFYLAPLLFVGAAAFLFDRRRPLALMAGAALFVWLVLAADMVFTATGGPYIASPASALHAALDGQTWALGNRFGFEDLQVSDALVVLVPLAAFAVAALGWLKSRPLASAVTAVAVLGYLVVGSEYALDRMEASQNGGQGAVGAGPLSERDWVDEAVRDGASAAIVPHYGHDNWTAMRIWWTAEAFNKSVTDSYVVPGGGDWTPFPDREMTVSSDGVIEISPSTDDPAEYLVMPVEEQIGFRPAGNVVASHRSDLAEDRGMEVLEVDEPYRAAWLTDGFLSDGWLESKSVGRIRVFPAAAGDAATPQRVRVTMQLEMPAVPPRASRFTIEGTRGATTTGLAAHGVINESATVCVPADAPAEVAVRPRRGIELPDGRVVVGRLTEVDTEALGGACRPR